jgi:hypothetical protein
VDEIDNWNVHALVGYHADALRLYIAGFREGAQILARAVIKGNEDAEFLVYPIVFLYRHCVELLLKRIIRQGRVLDGAEPTENRQHDLWVLWADAKAVISKHFPNTDTDRPENLDPLIIQLRELDPKSFSFRYDDGWKGRWTSINVWEFSNNTELIVEALGNYQLFLQAKIEGDNEVLALFDGDAESSNDNHC